MSNNTTINNRYKSVVNEIKTRYGNSTIKNNSLILYNNSKNNEITNE